MPISIPSRVVVFDYGEVISTTPSPRDRAELLAIAAVEAEPFWAAYWRHRDDLDAGRLAVPDYWARVADDLGTGFDAATVQRLWAADFRGWFGVDAGTVDVLAELHAGGTRLALLSNAGFDFGAPLRFAPFGRYFERVFVSAELGMLKPDPQIYRHVARELGVDPGAMVFVDNKEVNVRGAESIGVTGHVFTGAVELRAFLATLA